MRTQVRNPTRSPDETWKVHQTKSCNNNQKRAQDVYASNLNSANGVKNVVFRLPLFSASPLRNPTKRLKLIYTYSPLTTSNFFHSTHATQTSQNEYPLQSRKKDLYYSSQYREITPTWTGRYTPQQDSPIINFYGFSTWHITQHTGTQTSQNKEVFTTKSPIIHLHTQSP